MMKSLFRRCFLSLALWLVACLPHPSEAVAQAIPPLAALHANDTILFQGDSITDGGRWRTGSDYNHIMGQDYAYIVAARVGADYAERNLTFVNRGVGGDTVPKLLARWQTDTLDLKPNLLSILVGVNDTFFGESGETAEEYEKGYDRLLAETLAALPNAKIVLGEPFLLPVGNYKVDYPQRLAELKKRQEAVARLAAKYRLPMIHYQKMMTEACKRAPADHWSWDGVHPTYAGHALMSEAWMSAVDRAWPKR
jgi:lysophospholipase L1-like esterase